MRDGVIVANSEYAVIDLNPAAERITGFASHDAIGRPIADVFPGLASLRARTVPEERERRFEILVRQDDQPHFYDVIVTPMGGTGTGTAGYLCLFRDISERKQAELALAEANKKIGLLTSITRHDLTNKIVAVHSYLELIRDLSTDPLQKEYLDREEMALNAMSEQIAFTREYEQLGTELPVWQEVDAVIDRARALVDLRNVSLKSSNGSLEIFADPMLEKVFYNLFDNAVKYGGKKMSSITVTSRQAGEDLIIVVEDDGDGIAEEDKRRLFERGFGKNTGLGLFLSREILAITGIAIQETGEPARGARFEIRVPKGKFRSRTG